MKPFRVRKILWFWLGLSHKTEDGLARHGSRDHETRVCLCLLFCGLTIETKLHCELQLLGLLKYSSLKVANDFKIHFYTWIVKELSPSEFLSSLTLRKSYHYTCCNRSFRILRIWTRTKKRSFENKQTSAAKGQRHPVCRTEMSPCCSNQRQKFYHGATKPHKKWKNLPLACSVSGILPDESLLLCI